MKFNATAMTLAGVTACAALAATGAFAKPPKKAAPKKSAKPTAAQIAAGKKVYDAKGCAGCHAIAGKGGMGGPDLTDTGSDPKHTEAWFMAQVSNPKSHTPDSTMPAYADQIKGKDLDNLADYLTSLKKAGAAKK